MLRKLLVVLVAACVLMLLLTQVAAAQSLDISGQLVQIKQSIITVQNLEQQGLMTPSEADRAIAFYVAQASQLVGHPMTVQQILAVPDRLQPSLTPLQEFAGALTFLNAMLVLAIIAVGGAFIYLFKHYVRILFRILAHIPMLVYELTFYVLSLSSALTGWWLPAPMHQSLALLSCVLFAGALAFSVSYRRELAHAFIIAMILFLVWTPMAMLFASTFVGFLAVGALLTALGWNDFVLWAINELGARVRSRSSQHIEQATLAGFVVLTLFVTIRLLSSFVPVLIVFTPGSLIFGSVFGFGGLLALSDRWYDRRYSTGVERREGETDDEHAARWEQARQRDKNVRRKHYWGFQIVSIVAGIGALFFGSALQISELQKIGGTFFVVYLLVKLAEIPTRSRLMFAWLVVGTGALTVGFCWFALAHPELFRAWLFLPG
ncbi:MAG TPA: hypothetical protein VFV38_08215 [Ktedonobacteraceae bacterium]|nr:hypothetical protein [Ktedonobacteraceae bacterium]